MNPNTFLWAFILILAFILYNAPKELPQERLEVSIQGTVVRDYGTMQTPQCERTKHIVRDMLRGLHYEKEIKVDCREVQLSASSEADDGS